jgi:Kef-type K+ transport system membrane component KefB
VARGVAVDAEGSVHVKRIVGLVLLILALALVVRPQLEQRFGKSIRKRGALTTDQFAVLVIVLFVCAYLADRIGVNAIVGGFLAGLIMPAREITAKDLTGRLGDMSTSILLPIFLAVSGLRTDFTKLGSSFLVGIALFIVVGIVSKWISGIIFARAGGMSFAEGNVIGVLMNCRGLLVLVVALIALNSNVITAQMQVGGVLMALITTAMTGPLIDRFIPKVMAQAPAIEAEERVLPPSRSFGNSAKRAAAPNKRKR